MKKISHAMLRKHLPKLWANLKKITRTGQSRPLKRPVGLGNLTSHNLHISTCIQNNYWFKKTVFGSFFLNYILQKLTVLSST